MSLRHKVIGLSRGDTYFCNKSPDIDDEEKWLETIGDSEVIIHCAGRAHILNDKAESPLKEFRVANVEFSIKLANYAIKKEVGRFIFFSSLGVNGPATKNIAFTENMKPNPVHDYAVSKLEAEEALRLLFKDTGIELVIIRPPLVYSHNAPGNFRRLLKLVKTGLPLPFRGINNRRSLVSIDNLVSFVEYCCEHPKAADEIFLISDDEVVSTACILSCLYKGLGKKEVIFYFPEFIIVSMFYLLGLRAIYKKMFSNLEVSNLKAKQTLGWKPVENTYSALEELGKHFRKLEE